jgi:hypothetical protein
MQKSEIRRMSEIVLTGFIQVYFVSVNICLLSLGSTVGVLIASFLVSFTWSINVKRVAFGGLADRITYSLAASAGSIAGLLSSELIADVVKSLIQS